MITNDLVNARFKQDLDREIKRRLEERSLITVPVGDFVLSYVEQKPLFDGSDTTEEYFTSRHYNNYCLIREETVPISELRTPPVSDKDLGPLVDDEGNPVKLDITDVGSSEIENISTEELEQLTYENSLS